MVPVKQTMNRGAGLNMALYIFYHKTQQKCNGRLTHAQMVQWNIGSSGLCCRALTSGSPWILRSGSPRTYCQCSLWLAASCGAQTVSWHKVEEEKTNWQPCSTRELTSYCCPLHLRILGCLLWSGSAEHLPLWSALWTAPPENIDEIDDTLWKQFCQIYRSNSGGWLLKCK